MSPTVRTTATSVSSRRVCLHRPGCPSDGLAWLAGNEDGNQCHGHGAVSYHGSTMQTQTQSQTPMQMQMREANNRLIIINHSLVPATLDIPSRSRRLWLLAPRLRPARPIPSCLFQWLNHFVSPSSIYAVSITDTLDTIGPCQYRSHGQTIFFPTDPVRRQFSSSCYRAAIPSISCPAGFRLPSFLMRLDSCRRTGSSSVTSQWSVWHHQVGEDLPTNQQQEAKEIFFSSPRPPALVSPRSTLWCRDQPSLACCRSLLIMDDGLALALTRNDRILQPVAMIQDVAGVAEPQCTRPRTSFTPQTPCA
ncbi:hypothetical protein K456DRAFT_1374831 [Colletotrichum gloeosporioides 23]|nr:hypothetical protein K456DRAFT_1374831 [Colletotrichum gloeosporioides 23]